MAVSLEVFEARLDALLGESEVVINWDIAMEALRAARGIPVMIGLELLPDEPAAGEPAAGESVPSESNEGDVVPTVNG